MNNEVGAGTGVVAMRRSGASYQQTEGRGIMNGARDWILVIEKAAILWIIL